MSFNNLENLNYALPVLHKINKAVNKSNFAKAENSVIDKAKMRALPFHVASHFTT